MLGFLLWDLLSVQPWPFLYSHFSSLYSMKIKEQTRKLAAGCSKQCFEVADKTDEVNHIYTARRR